MVASLLKSIRRTDALDVPKCRAGVERLSNPTAYLPLHRAPKEKPSYQNDGLAFLCTLVPER